MDWVVAPFDHTFPVSSEDVSSTFPPLQKAVGPFALITGVAGIAFTVTITGADAGDTHPLRSVNTPVYVPDVLTVTDAVVSPVDQVVPVASEEVSITEPPSQNSAGPLSVTEGAAGSA